MAHKFVNGARVSDKVKPDLSDTRLRPIARYALERRLRVMESADTFAELAAVQPGQTVAQARARLYLLRPDWLAIEWLRGQVPDLSLNAAALVVYRMLKSEPQLQKRLDMALRIEKEKLAAWDALNEHSSRANAFRSVLAYIRVWFPGESDRAYMDRSAAAMTWAVRAICPI